MSDESWFNSRSWSNPDDHAHPDSPAGGGGPGGFSQPGPLGFTPTPPNRGPEGSTDGGLDPPTLAIKHAKRKLRQYVDDLASAPNWDRLRYVAEAMLGPYSFGIGVSVGIVKAPVDDVVGLLELQKTFVLADLYDRLYESESGLGLGSVLFGNALSALRLGAAGLLALGVLRVEDLKQARDDRDHIIEELQTILRNPAEFLTSLPGKVRDEYVVKWRAFSQMSNQPGLENRFKAGVLCGELLAELVLSLAGVITGAGAAVSIASKLPKLTKFAKLAKRASRGGTPDRSAAPATKATRPPTSEPPKPAAPRPTPEPPQAPPSQPPKTAQPPPSTPKAPLLKGVTQDELDLAAKPGNSKLQIKAREKIAKRYYKQRAGMTAAQARNHMRGIDFKEPLIIGPPPPCPPVQSQWQVAGGSKGQYFGDAGIPPEQFGVYGKGATKGPGGWGTGPVQPKVVKEYSIPPETPYMQTKAGPIKDDWSVSGHKYRTEGGATQRFISKREPGVVEKP